MNKISNYTLIFLLFLVLSCDYKPILAVKDYKFSISVKEISGDQKINSLIINNFKNLKNDERIYFINLTSKKEKKIISKDTKGDPSIFELEINVNYKLEKNGEIVIQKNINRKTTYNNITDKFELENYENSIIENLTQNISDKIVFSVSEIN
jgi:hypothetical protein|tara:strand:+ start:217 stop:672 length:456 start_codon:yes stop_codon:yes gene_type:complete